MKAYIEEKLEDWMGLEINREKTRVINLREKGASLDFLGYTFRYDRDLKGGNWCYLNVFPAHKALKKEREQLRAMINTRASFKPLPTLISELNRHLRGWANYFSYGYPSMAYRHIDYYVRLRLSLHLKRRSQRPFRPPQGKSKCQHLNDLGLVQLSARRMS